MDKETVALVDFFWPKVMNVINLAITVISLNYARKHLRLNTMKWESEKEAEKRKWRERVFETFKDPRMHVEKRAAEWISENVSSEAEIKEACDIMRAAMTHEGRVDFKAFSLPGKVEDLATQLYAERLLKRIDRANRNRKALEDKLTGGDT